MSVNLFFNSSSNSNASSQENTPPNSLAVKTQGEASKVLNRSPLSDITNLKRNYSQLKDANEIKKEKLSSNLDNLIEKNLARLSSDHRAALFELMKYFLNNEMHYAISQLSQDAAEKLSPFLSCVDQNCKPFFSSKIERIQASFEVVLLLPKGRDSIYKFLMGKDLSILKKLHEILSKIESEQLRARICNWLDINRPIEPRLKVLESIGDLEEDHQLALYELIRCIPEDHLMHRVTKLSLSEARQLHQIFDETTHNYDHMLTKLALSLMEIPQAKRQREIDRLMNIYFLFNGEVYGLDKVFHQTYLFSEEKKIQLLNDACEIAQYMYHTKKDPIPFHKVVCLREEKITDFDQFLRDLDALRAIDYIDFEVLKEFAEIPPGNRRVSLQLIQSVFNPQKHRLVAYIMLFKSSVSHWEAMIKGADELLTYYMGMNRPELRNYQYTPFLLYILHSAICHLGKIPTPKKSLVRESLSEHDVFKKISYDILEQDCIELPSIESSLKLDPTIESMNDLIAMPPVMRGKIWSGYVENKYSEFMIRIAYLLRDRYNQKIEALILDLHANIPPVDDVSSEEITDILSKSKPDMIIRIIDKLIGFYGFNLRNMSSRDFVTLVNLLSFGCNQLDRTLLNSFIDQIRVQTPLENQLLLGRMKRSTPRERAVAIFSFAPTTESITTICNPYRNLSTIHGVSQTLSLNLLQRTLPALFKNKV